jgi:hypothetical protein
MSFISMSFISIPFMSAECAVPKHEADKARIKAIAEVSFIAFSFVVVG